MVRLKRVKQNIYNYDNPKFQSHNGSIKTLYNSGGIIKAAKFQSHNGSIKTLRLFKI